MPVMVLGADTPLGEAILAALVAPDREVRAFVSDPGAAARFKEWGVKVALGDLSDLSHVEAACSNCFSVVAVTSALTDGRSLAFGADPRQLASGWARAVTAAGIHRLIWVGDDLLVGEAAVPEQAVVDTSAEGGSVVERVVALDDAASLD